MRTSFYHTMPLLAMLKRVCQLEGQSCSHQAPLARPAVARRRGESRVAQNRRRRHNIDLRVAHLPSLRPIPADEMEEARMRAFCDVFGGIARMGVKRQIHDFRNVLKQVYVQAEVLVCDQDVISDPIWRGRWDGDGF